MIAAICAQISQADENGNRPVHNIRRYQGDKLGKKSAYTISVGLIKIHVRILTTYTR